MHTTTVGALLWRCPLATTALVVSLLVAVSIQKRRRLLSDYGQDEGVQAKFLEHVFEWCASLAVVLTLYHVLLLLLASGWEWITSAS